MCVTCQLQSWLRTAKSDSHQEGPVMRRAPFEARVHHVGTERKPEVGLGPAANNRGCRQNALRLK